MTDKTQNPELDGLDETAGDGATPLAEPECACEGYTIRTDYGTGVEYDVDRSGCPVHDPDPGVSGPTTAPFCDQRGCHRRWNSELGHTCRPTTEAAGS